MAKTTAKPTVRVENYSQSLKVQLTVAEIADAADRAARLLADRDRMEDDMKAAAKNAKAEIEAIEAEMRLLSERVRTRATYRTVECERRFDHGVKRVFEVRIDTNETINERPMTKAELQMQLPFPEPAEQPAEA